MGAKALWLVEQAQRVVESGSLTRTIVAKTVDIEESANYLRRVRAHFDSTGEANSQEQNDQAFVATCIESK